MRLALLVMIAALGCQGERVESTTPTDAATDGGACSVPGNLLNNGDFSSGASGWNSSGFGIELIDGPCGRALRLSSSTAYASLTRAVTTGPALKKGMNLRVRAMFRESGRMSGNTPQVVARFYRKNDLGEELPPQTIEAGSLGSETWHAVEATGLLENDATGADVYVTSRSTEADAFDVAAVSLVVVE
jgi:hypothetical protein